MFLLRVSPLSVAVTSKVWLHWWLGGWPEEQTASGTLAPQHMQVETLQCLHGSFELPSVGLI